MSKKLLFLISGLSFFLIFIFFSYLVHKNIFTQSDFNTTVRLQDNMPRRFDELFSTFSILGDFEVSLVILLIILAIRRKLLTGIALFGAFGLFHLVEIYGKSFVSHLPPPQFMLRTHLPVDFPQFHVRLQNSYPSGHSGRTLFLSVILGVFILRSKWLSWWWKCGLLSLLLIYDLIMVVSRVYLGEHWTSDVIGGGLLGAALALMSLSLPEITDIILTLKHIRHKKLDI